MDTQFPVPNVCQGGRLWYETHRGAGALNRGWGQRGSPQAGHLLCSGPPARGPALAPGRHFHPCTQGRACHHPCHPKRAHRAEGFRLPAREWGPAQGWGGGLWGKGRALRPAPGPLSHQAVKIPQQTELVDEDAMSQIRKGHDTMCVVLTSRHKNLDTVRAVWTTGDIKARAILAPAPGFGLTEKRATGCGEAGIGSPFTTVADSTSSTLVLTSCHLLSTCL